MQNLYQPLTLELVDGDPVFVRIVVGSLSPIEVPPDETVTQPFIELSKIQTALHSGVEQTVE